MPRKNDIRILVVDDEPDVLELVVFHLEKQQYKVAVADTGDKALKMARENLPSMLILDLMLPGINGLEICRLLKRDSKTRNIPILMLTARAAEEDRVKGLELGAHDYVTKPFSLEEVVARLRVILRRSGRGIEEPRTSRLTFADIEIDEDTHEVWKAGEPVSLSPTELPLLRYFIINAGTVLSKPKILDHVWRYDFGGDVNVVESYVSYLRRKIDTGDKRLLHTLRGVGYVLREPR